MTVHDIAMRSTRTTGRGAEVILVEDDRRTAESIRRFLAREGFAVYIASNGAEFRRLYRRYRPDLVLIDRTLGAEDGLHLVQEIIRSGDVGVILVTGRDASDDRITGLESGADDYVTKPFVPAELLARIRAVLRRRHKFSGPIDEGAEFGPLRLNPQTMTVEHTETGAKVELTETESRIIEILMREAGRSVSRSTLMAREIVNVEDRSVDVHIANIRRKLRGSHINDLRIYPVRGFGYRVGIDQSGASTFSELG
jgi:DNA-binding response OmpR family regulator